MIPRPLSWVEIIKIRSATFRKAESIAKKNCSLPLHKSRGAFLQVHDKDGKQLVCSDAICFPRSSADWKGMIKKVKEFNPKAHSLHILTIVDSAEGWRAAEAGNMKLNTGSASQLVYVYEGAEVL